MLLTHNASIDYRDGQAIRQAAAQGHSSILQILLDRDPNPAHLPEALRQAMQIQTGSICPLRLQTVRLLTRPGVNNSATVHRALIQAVREEDHDLIEHLLKSGGDPNFDHGTSVIVASKQADVKALKLLAKAQPTPKVYSDAFTAIQNSEAFNQFEHDLLLRIYQILLDGGASGPSVDQTFLNAMASPDSSAKKFVALVLSCRYPSLNVDFEAGKSLRLAVQKNALDIVKDLMGRGPNQTTTIQAFMAVFESNADEPSLMKMAELFFYHSEGTNHIYFGKDDTSTSPLYQVLHHHPNKPRLLQYLLDNGCPANSHFGWQFTPDHGVEQISALLWLLCQADDQNRTDTRTVKILLDQGGTNQPVGACGFGQDILDARREAEVLRKQQAEQARSDAEERARHDARQATLEEDAAAERRREQKRHRAKQATLEEEAAADRRRERGRLAVIFEGKRAEATAEERRLTAIEAGRRAEAREEARQLEAVEAAERAKRDREGKAFNDHLQRTRAIATDEGEWAKRQSDRRAKASIAEAKIKKYLIKEQKGLIESTTEMVRETRYAGVGGHQAGRILGEIKDGQNLLL
ncbi:hypothetical protein P7C71_g3563, partial [Lecanoromycetidae sp. Uapishka_2]